MQRTAGSASLPLSRWHRRLGQQVTCMNTWCRSCRRSQKTLIVRSPRDFAPPMMASNVPRRGTAAYQSRCVNAVSSAHLYLASPAIGSGSARPSVSWTQATVAPQQTSLVGTLSGRGRGCEQHVGGYTTSLWQRGRRFNLWPTCRPHGPSGRSPVISSANTISGGTRVPTRQRCSPERGQVRRVRRPAGAVRVAAAPQQSVGQVWPSPAVSPPRTHGGRGWHAALQL